MPTQEFQFRFLIYRCRAALDDFSLTVTQGVRSWQVELHRLRHFYIHVVPATGIECLIGFETPEGKKKVRRINANLGDPGFTAFTRALATARPEADLRSLAPRDAYRRLGTGNPQYLVPAIVIPIVVVLLGLIFLPNLVHGFDAGHAEIDAAACRADCPSGSRNVTLVNGSLHEEYLSQTKDNEVKRHYLLYVPSGWEKTDPVYLVVQTPALPSASMDRLLAEERLSGVLRNVLWEGLDADCREKYRKQWGVVFAPEARLVEYEADTSVEFYIALIVSGLALLVAAVVSVIVVRNR